MIWLWVTLRVVFYGLIIVAITTGWIGKFYFWLCWNLGFKDKDNNEETTYDREYITFMLRRQVQRLTWLWWVLSLGTIVGLTVWLTILGMLGRWNNLDFPFILFGLACWLLPHVMYTATFSPERNRK